ncbi:hypothetical protein HAAEEKHM_00018 [Sinorhizobium phage AP-16-3]|nr:hypothetical protein HAAEEKHM_00018 [Sinorhizobium phage AP-16-3]
MVSEKADRCVYFHRRPDTGDVFYVGIGSAVRAASSSGRNGRWKDIVSEYGKPVVEIVADNLTTEDAANIERSWIRHFGLQNLANISPGGDSVFGFSHSHETRRRLSEAGKGRAVSEETRKKIGDANRGKKRTEEVKSRMSIARVGRALAEDTRRKISISHIGISPSAETRKKLSDANKGKSPSEETRAKMSAAGKGRVKSPEHLRNIGDALKGKPKSEETRRKLSESKSNEHSKGRDATVYKFTHDDHGTAELTRYKMRVEFGLPKKRIGDLVTGARKSYRGWRILAAANDNNDADAQSGVT